MKSFDRADVVRIGEALDIYIPDDWSLVDAVWPLLDRMRADGAMVLIKLDGARTGPRDSGPYTLLVSGAPLQGAHLRTDTFSLEDGLCSIITGYAKKVWNIDVRSRTSS